MTRVFTIIFLVVSLKISAQNLVPNPDFESVNSVQCDFTLPGEFNPEINSWKSANKSTPDVFTLDLPFSCNNYPFSTTFQGKVGEQQPHSGRCMAGLHLYGFGGYNGLTSTRYREYLEVPLKQTLVAGKQYYVEAYVSLGDEAKYAINNFGFAFSNASVYFDSFTVVKNVDIKVVTNSLIAVKNSWYKISGKFTATSNYTNLLLGNFYEDGNFSKTIINSNGNDQAYYFFDDIALFEANTLEISGNSSICSDHVYDSAFLSVKGDTSNVTFYKWVDNANSSVVLSNNTSLTVKPANTATYTLYTNVDTVQFIVNIDVCDVRASFNTQPDTLCAHTNLIFNNQSLAANNYQWNFVKGNDIYSYTNFNLNNPYSLLDNPTQLDINYDGKKYVGFFTDVSSSGANQLNRYSFGTDITNSPEFIFPATDDLLVFNFNIYKPGPFVLYNDGKDNFQFIWSLGGTGTKLYKASYGTSLLNYDLDNSLGNSQNVIKPTAIDLVKDDNNRVYLFTADSANAVFRYLLSKDLSVIEQSTKITLTGVVNIPNSIKIVKENNTWFAVLTNQSNTNLTKLNFGNSLNNTPTAANQDIGVNGKQIRLFDNCGVIDLLVVTNNSIQQIEYKNGVANNFTTKKTMFANTQPWTSLATISKVFNRNADHYFYAIGKDASSQSKLFRIKIATKNDAGIALSNQASPNNISFDSAGIYTIVLTAIQTTNTTNQICKEVLIGDNSLVPNLSLKHDTLFSNTIAQKYYWFKNGSLISTTSTNFLKIAAFGNGTYQVQTEASDCRSLLSGNLNVNLTAVKVNAQDFADKLEIYPNPSDGNVTLQNKLNVKINFLVYNIEGKMLKNGTLESNQKMLIDLTNEAKGLFFIKFENENDVFTTKLILN